MTGSVSFVVFLELLFVLLHCVLGFCQASNLKCLLFNAAIARSHVLLLILAGAGEFFLP